MPSVEMLLMARCSEPHLDQEDTRLDRYSRREANP